MSTFSIREESPGKLTLGGELSIYEAAALKDALLAKLWANEALDIDLAEVIELDSAGVQIMLLLHREAKAAGKRLHWHRHSPAASRVLNLLNLSSTLGEPVSLVWS